MWNSCFDNISKKKLLVPENKIHFLTYRQNSDRKWNIQPKLRNKEEKQVIKVVSLSFNHHLRFNQGDVF